MAGTFDDSGVVFICVGRQANARQFLELFDDIGDPATQSERTSGSDESG